MSGILDNPATKWDRAGELGGSLLLFTRRGSRSRSRAGRGISLNATHTVHIIQHYQTPRTAMKGMISVQSVSLHSCLSPDPAIVPVKGVAQRYDENRAIESIIR